MYKRCVTKHLHLFPVTRCMIVMLLRNAPDGEWRNVHAEIHSRFFSCRSATSSSVPLGFIARRRAEGFALKLCDGYISERRLAVLTGSQIWKGESLIKPFKKWH